MLQRAGGILPLHLAMGCPRLIRPTESTGMKGRTHPGERCCVTVLPGPGCQTAAFLSVQGATGPWERPVHPLAGAALGCGQAFPTDPVQEALPCWHINRLEDVPCSDLWGRVFLGSSWPVT